MRQISDHKSHGDMANAHLEVRAMEDGPGTGAASHYEVIGSTDTEPRAIIFFKDSLAEVRSTKEITDETLLAILIDRQREHQNGICKSRDTAIALTGLEDAMLRLQRRTADRIARGVEGTKNL